MEPVLSQDSWHHGDWVGKNISAAKYIAVDHILCTLYDIVAFAIDVTTLWGKKS